MPRTAKSQSPSEVLQKFIDDYQTNPFALSKSLNVAYQSVTFILKGKARISPKMALRLSTHFGNPVNYWLDIQTSADLAELSSDKKFQSSLKKVTKVQKLTGKPKEEPKAGKRKTKTLAKRRKTAAKVPVAKATKGKSI